MYTALVVSIAASAAIVIAIARDGEISREPWGYVAVAVAILSAVTGLLLAFAQAAFESYGHHR
jgi:uncharacterized membrane protein (DUF4010 family)